MTGLVDDIKLTTMPGVLFTVALIVSVLIIPTTLMLFKKTADGSMKIALIIMALLSLSLHGITWK